MDRRPRQCPSGAGETIRARCGQFRRSAHHGVVQLEQKVEPTERVPGLAATLSCDGRIDRGSAPATGVAAQARARTGR